MPSISMSRFSSSWVLSAVRASRAWTAASPGSTRSSGSTLGTVDVGTDGPALLSKTTPVGHEAEQNLNTDGPPRAVDGVALATPF